jgi:molybdopterin-guanine dinucleotide biosynthesis protein A
MSMKGTRRNSVGVVLAGGISRRFGSEKALLVWQGRSFLRIAAERLGPLCDEVVLSVDRPGRFNAGFSVRQILDFEPGGGAAVGILSVLRACGGACALVTPVDMPLMPAGMLGRLLEARGGSEAVVLKVRGRWQPLVGVYEPGSAAVIERCLGEGERRILHILRRMKTRVVRPGPGEVELLVNINSPADYRRLQRRERD